MACEGVITELIEGIGDVLVMEEGPRRWDVRPGIYEIGASRAGIMSEQDLNGISKVTVNLVEMHPSQVLNRWTDAPDVRLSTLIGMAQDPHTKLITMWLFYNAHLLSMDMDMPWRGEAMSYPASWQYNGGHIIRQTQV